MKKQRVLDISKCSQSFRDSNPELMRGIERINKDAPLREMLDAKLMRPTGVRKDKPDEEKMNKTERNFAAYIKRLYGAKLIPWPVRLKWGGSMHYMPDFGVMRLGRMVLIEVKGPHIRSRDIVRFKGCKAEWSDVFQFEMWQLASGEWKQLL